MERSGANAEAGEKVPLLSIMTDKVGVSKDLERQGSPAVKASLAPHYMGLSMTTLVILYYAVCSSTMLVRGFRSCLISQNNSCGRSGNMRVGPIPSRAGHQQGDHPLSARAHVRADVPGWSLHPTRLHGGP